MKLLKSSRKGNVSFDVQDVVGNISTKFGKVTETISKIANSRLDLTRLYREIIAVKVMRKGS